MCLINFQLFLDFEPFAHFHCPQLRNSNRISNVFIDVCVSVALSPDFTRHTLCRVKPISCPHFLKRILGRVMDLVAEMAIGVLGSYCPGLSKSV